VTPPADDDTGGIVIIIIIVTAVPTLTLTLFVGPTPKTHRLPSLSGAAAGGGGPGVRTRSVDL